MALVINIDGAIPDYLQTVQIEGRSYRIRSVWEARTESWYLSLGTTSEWLIEGVRATAGRQTLARTHADMPAGGFALIDLDGGGDPLQEELGDRVLLAYDSDGVPPLVQDVVSVEVT
uniref:Cyanophage baseplate Pam3 plug gp18 domain-containing protein n=1 Tax=viral metagenome TaxID=1070528 RepID=A0A6M3LIH3_9ZZZZ